MKIHNPTIWMLIGLLSVASGCQSGMVGQSGGGSMSDRRQSMFGSNGSREMALANGMVQARELERSGQIEASLQGYARIAEANPDLPIVWHRLAVAYDKLGHRPYADACYERALALDPMNADLWCDYGYGRFLQGEMIDADRAFRRALELNPGLQRAHNNLGLALARSGNTSEAMEQFRLAGCDTRQATQNLELAAKISTPVQTANRSIAAPSQAMAVAANPPAAAMTAEATPRPMSKDDAPLSNQNIAAVESPPAIEAPAVEMSAPISPSEAPLLNQEVAATQSQAVTTMPVEEMSTPMDSLKAPLPNEAVAATPSQPEMAMSVDEMSAQTSEPDARLPNTMVATAPNRPLTPMPSNVRQMGDDPIDGALPVAGPTVEQNRGSTYDESASAMVRPIWPNASMVEKIAQLNRYAVDPSVAKSDLPPPKLVAPVESAKTADSPKAFSESNEPSFVKPASDAERGVYTLITDLQSVRESSDTSGNETINVVRRIGDIDE